MDLSKVIGTICSFIIRNFREFPLRNSMKVKSWNTKSGEARKVPVRFQFEFQPDRRNCELDPTIINQAPSDRRFEGVFVFTDRKSVV